MCLLHLFPLNWQIRTIMEAAPCWSLLEGFLATEFKQAKHLTVFSFEQGVCVKRWCTTRYYLRKHGGLKKILAIEMKASGGCDSAHSATVKANWGQSLKEKWAWSPMNHRATCSETWRRKRRSNFMKECNLIKVQLHGSPQNKLQVNTWS